MLILLLTRYTTVETALVLLARADSLWTTPAICEKGRVISIALRSLGMSSRLIIPVSVVILLSVVFVPRVWARQALENPPPDSFQSGIGVISGWACAAQEIEISFNGGPRLKAAVGTIREDTQGVCGDTDNGFGLLYNWNRLGDGAHTVAAYADGVEFASVQVIVTTLGEEFLQGARGTLPLPDFPIPGETRTLRWQQAQQNFVITAGSPQGGGMSGAAPHVLENPQPGSFQSGVGVISGWACEAQTIEVSFDGGPRIQAGTGTIREDTQGVCGDTDNGFGLLYNWNRLGEGVHTVTAYTDGAEFAEVTVTVTTLGEEFRRGLSREVTIPDFPEIGTDAVLQWQEAQQNFVVASNIPTERLVGVTPTLSLPAGVSIPNVAVTSLYVETYVVRASPEPSLLLAQDTDGTVLLALANDGGGLLGESPGEVEVSVESTAVTLVGFLAGIAVSDMIATTVNTIVTHRDYPALLVALSEALTADKNLLDSLYDYPVIMSLLRAVADGLSSSSPQAVGPTFASVEVDGGAIPAPSATPISGQDCLTRQRLTEAQMGGRVVERVTGLQGLSTIVDTITDSQTFANLYTTCAEDYVRRTGEVPPALGTLQPNSPQGIDIVSAVRQEQYRFKVMSACSLPAARQLRKRFTGEATRDSITDKVIGLHTHAAGWLGAVIEGMLRHVGDEARIRDYVNARQSECEEAECSAENVCMVETEIDGQRRLSCTDTPISAEERDNVIIITTFKDECACRESCERISKEPQECETPSDVRCEDEQLATVRWYYCKIPDQTGICGRTCDFCEGWSTAIGEPPRACEESWRGSYAFARDRTKADCLALLQSIWGYQNYCPGPPDKGAPDLQPVCRQ